MIDISADGFLSMMNDNGDLREDLKLPDGDLGSQLKTDFENGRELLVIIKLHIFLKFSIN